MYVTAPSAPAPPGSTEPVRLGLARVDYQQFTDGAPYGWDDHVYFRDLLRAFGLDCPPEQFQGRRNSFTDMVSAMATRLRPRHDRFDVAVLTGVTPDSQPGFPMCRLTELVTHAGLAFAVFDQGVLAPFTALEVLASILRAHRATDHSAAPRDDTTTGDGESSALLMVMEQSALMLEQPMAERFQVAQDSAVVLVLTDTGGLGTVSTPTTVMTDASDVTAHLTDALAATEPAPGQRRVLVCGFGIEPTLAPVAEADEVLHCPPGRPGAGVWIELAEHIDEWTQSGAQVVLADHDDVARRLSLCTVDLPRATAGVRSSDPVRTEVS
jgi:hypothetical protein